MKKNTLISIGALLALASTLSIAEINVFGDDGVVSSTTQSVGTAQDKSKASSGMHGNVENGVQEQKRKREHQMEGQSGQQGTQAHQRKRDGSGQGQKHQYRKGMNSGGGGKK